MGNRWKKNHTTSTSMWELLCSVLIVDQLNLICHAMCPLIKLKHSNLILFCVFMAVVWAIFMIVKKRVWSEHQCQTKRHYPMLFASNVSSEDAQLSSFSLKMSSRFPPMSCTYLIPPKGDKHPLSRMQLLVHGVQLWGCGILGLWDFMVEAHRRPMLHSVQTSIGTSFLFFCLLK